MNLLSGVPTVDMVEAVMKCEEYRELRDYSEHYLHANERTLNGYRWIRDSFHQWSRVYEYPYCYQTLRRRMKPFSQVLDAGSGVTFFPFFLANQHRVTCIDQDDYSEIYKFINSVQETDVKFVCGGLSDTPFSAASFDAIYCISVLEHTENHRAILEEFARLLRPNGQLVITFDIAVNRNQLGLTAELSHELIADISELFYLEESTTLLANLRNDSVYTTRYVARNMSVTLLPWRKLPILETLKTMVRGGQNYWNVDLTFCSLTAVRR